MSAEFLQKMFGLDGQVAVVIGGAGVLGGALSFGLAGAGAKIVIADMSEDPCQKRVAELQAAGFEARSVIVDVTKRESIANLLNEAKQWTGRVQSLVNCAGVNAGTTFLDATDADWDRIMTINLRSVFQACQIFAEHMVEAGGGSILNIGSVTSHLPLSKVFAYSASKAGVVNLTRNVAREFATQGVRCNAICPGFFPAKQNQKLLDAQRVANIMGHTPMKRYGTPDELVGAALLCLSPVAGSYLTGSLLSVDGGFSAAWF